MKTLRIGKKDILVVGKKERENLWFDLCVVKADMTMVIDFLKEMESKHEGNDEFHQLLRSAECEHHIEFLNHGIKTIDDIFQKLIESY